MTETYNITEFTSGIKSSQLYEEIIDNSNIITVLTGIRIHTLEVEIVFQSVISSEERTELDGIVSSHVPDNSITTTSTKFINNLVTNWKGKSGTYTRVAAFIFKGDILTIDTIKFVGYKHSNVSSYDVRVINTNNTNILTEQTFSNSSEQLNDMIPISNIPTEEVLLEVHAKKNSGKEIYIDNITFFLSTK